VLASFTPDQFRTLAQEPGAVLLVAEFEGNIAGYVVMRFGSHHADICTEIETLYVQACFAGQGIGSALLTHARDNAMTKTGSRSIWLMVNSRNENAITFYRSCGMRQDGVAYFELGGTKHENRVMVAVD
jgi:ribosomal protein S18 acetylase RimI-like enzyme